MIGKSKQTKPKTRNNNKSKQPVTTAQMETNELNTKQNSSIIEARTTHNQSNN